MGVDYDFCGWATKNDLECSDGRIIRRDAFLDDNGQTVPLVWQHRHDDPINVLGHAVLENRPEGVFCYGYFNESALAQHSKMLIDHGDIKALSIYANKLKQNGKNVLHGSIKEVSLVLAGANPGATVLAHSDYDWIEGEDIVIQFVDEDECIASHFDADIRTNPDKEEEAIEHEDKEPKEEKDMADTEKKEAENKEETISDVIDTMNDKQKNAMYFVVGKALEDAGVDIEDEEGDDEEMKHNVFDAVTDTHEAVLSHSDMATILDEAKRGGSLREAMKAFADQNDVELVLQHTDPEPVSGFGSYGSPANVSLLFPEYADPNGKMPELITNDQGWVDVVLSKVHKSPFSRVRTSHVDIRNIDALRAKGYQKGKQKTIVGNYSAVRRETDPQTVYVTSALNRDDVVDITDFDYVQYQYNIDRMQLNEELAMAIMLGDFRADDAEGKISPSHIRPIWTDDELYTLHADIDISAMRESLQGTETGSYFGDNFVYAEALIEKLLYTRENMRGSGNPDFFMTPHMLNVMLLARDRNGHRVFSSKAELASALNVNNIYTAEQFANRIRTDSSNNQHKLLGICVNLNDYNVGATKGGQITHFTDFDLKFNQLESLLETRCSGALKRVYSAVVIEEPYTA